MEPIKDVGGKQWAKTLSYTCLSWVHSSSAELPAPRFTHEMRPHFIHVQARQARSLGLCAGNGVNHQSIAFCFLEFPSHSSKFCSKGTIRTNQAQVGRRCSRWKVMPWGPYLATFA